ncbi:MAG: AAA family ATPase [Candidatus Woesearchaeota archaeon]
MDRIRLYSQDFTEFLEGGLQKGIISGLYGPAASGKTLTCILAMLSPDLVGKKIVYIDTEKGLSTDRIKQIMPDCNEQLNNTIFFNPKNFPEMQKICEKLDKVINEKFGLIIVDTISSSYRLEIANKSDQKKLNQDFVNITSHLSKISKDYDIPILVTTQVYADMNNEDSESLKLEEKENNNRDKVLPIGGFILKNRCKCFIELIKLNKNNRMAVIKNHSDIEPGKEMFFKIIGEGIEKFERPN